MAEPVMTGVRVTATLLLILFSLAISSSSAVKLKSSSTHLFVAETAYQDSNRAPQRQWLKGSNSALLQRQRRETEAMSSAVEVRQFHMKSVLYSRFASVTIDSEVVSLSVDRSQEVTFQVQVPESAFMSNFTMVVDGQLHVAKVLEKEAAEQAYQEARKRNQTAAQVKQDPVKVERGFELFTIAINLAPNASASFTLLYNELLERRGGSYTQTLALQPGAIVDNLTVTTTFAEPQGFTYFAYTLPGGNTKLTTSSPDKQTELRASINSRELIFRPSVEMQRELSGERGMEGLLTIYYSLHTEAQGGSIIVQNEYFAHFFATDDLDPIPKNILFIIDISGSMSGDKILQAREAMLNILNDLKTRPTDTFNILLFDDRVEFWQPSPVSASAAQVERAKGFVRERLESRGGTDIYQALMKGLSALLGDSQRSCDKASMIVFLTDGDPTSGEITDTATIVSRVTAANRQRASVHSLGFGFNLNFDFLSKLSLRNRGLVRRIYDEGDAQDQLRGFYQEISSPVLCDVVASYNQDLVSVELLTLHNFPVYFQGHEIVVAGKTRLAGNDADAAVTTDYAQWDARLSGMGVGGQVNLIVPDGQVQVVDEVGLGAEGDLTERLWAYMKVKSLLADMQRTDSKEDRARLRGQALNMSLSYGLVTPLTSFSIVVDSSNQQQASGDMNHRLGAGSPSRAQGLAGLPALVFSLVIGLLVIQ